MNSEIESPVTELKLASKAVSIKKATFMMSFLGAVHLILGLLKSVFLAMAFGAGILVDAYSIGTYFPLFLITFLGLELLRSVLVAAFSKLEINKEANPSEVFSSVLSLFFLASGIIIPLGIIFAPFLVNIIAPEVTEETKGIAINVTRMAAPSVMFLAVGALTSSIMLAYKEYACSHVFELLSRAILVISAILCIFIPNIYILTLGFVGGQLIAAIFSLKLVFGMGLNYQFRLRLSSLFKSILSQTLYVWFGVLAFYTASVILRRYASAFEEGTIASLVYAQTLFSAVITMISVPLFRAVVPQFSRLAAQGDIVKERRLFGKSFRQGSYAALVLTVLFWFQSDQIVLIVLKRGAFDAQAAEITSTLLKWTCLGIWGNIISYQANAVMYAHKKTHFIMISHILTGASIILILSFGKARFGLEILGISYGLSLLIKGLAGTVIVKRIINIKVSKALSWLYRFGITGVAAISGVYFYNKISVGTGFWQNIVFLIGASLAVSLTFILVGLLTGLKEIRSFMNFIIFKRVWTNV